MCVRLLIAVVFTISLLSRSKAQSLDYHEEDSTNSVSVRGSEREIQHQSVDESEREIEQERVRLAALEAELQEELKLKQAANVEEDGLAAIPGLPGQDYPVYTSVPQTSFSCADKLLPGYYADVEARCQVFHICDPSGAKHSFLCPSGSLFNQKYLVCDWWYTSGCDPAENLLVYRHDFNRIIHSEENRHANEFTQNADFVPNNEYFSSGEENYISLQSDIFHSAETGVPNRELFQNSKDTSKNNNDNQVKKSSVDENSRLLEINVGNSTVRTETITKPTQRKHLKEKSSRDYFKA